MAGVRDPQTTLDQLYTVRDDLLTGKLQAYTIGDRSITLLNMTELDKMISKYENLVLAKIPVHADLSGIAHLPQFPEG